MMGQLIRLPLDTTVFDRLNAHQRNANIAAERADWVRIARQVLRSPKYCTDQELRDACATLQAWGDGSDYLTADAMIFTLNKREREQAHAKAREAFQPQHRWQDVLAGAVAFTGFWWGVVALVMGVGG